MSFKVGTGERVAEDRLFVDYTAETLPDSLVFVEVEIADEWISNDARPHRGNVLWLNAVALRPHR
jgi:hypothetical protein